jgi:hypothetical protein
MHEREGWFWGAVDRLRMVLYVVEPPPAPKNVSWTSAAMYSHAFVIEQAPA